MSKQKSLILLKMLMGILNFAILTFLAVIILYTIGMVRATYTARSFLNHITYLPMNPVKTVIVMYVALFTLVAIINLRQQSENSILNQTIYILEVILCGIIICCVYMEYKGIIFLVIADIVVLIRDKTSQKVFLVIMGLIYIFADYDIISLGIKMVSFRELLNVYTVRQHMLMTGILLSVQLLFLNFVHINHIRGESINILILNGIVFHFQKDRMVKICQKQRQC